MAQLESFKEFHDLMFKAIGLGLKVVESPKDFPKVNINPLKIHAECFQVIVRTEYHQLDSVDHVYTKPSARRLKEAIEYGQIKPHNSYVVIEPVLIELDVEDLKKYIACREGEEFTLKALKDLETTAIAYRDQLKEEIAEERKQNRKKTARKAPAVKKPIRKRK